MAKILISGTIISDFPFSVKGKCLNYIAYAKYVTKGRITKKVQNVDTK